MTSPSRVASTSAVAALVLATVWLFWPTTLGGAMTYVATHGSSMEPEFYAGDLALLSGAVYSGWQFWRRGAGAERLLSTCLIALGAFAPSLGGSLNRFGVTDVFYWGELLGVLLIFAGFLASSDVFSRARRAGRRRGRYHAAVDGPQPHTGTGPGVRLPAGDRPLSP